MCKLFNVRWALAELRKQLRKGGMGYRVWEGGADFPFSQVFTDGECVGR